MKNLKNVKFGTKLYSPQFGDVIFIKEGNDAIIVVNSSGDKLILSPEHTLLDGKPLKFRKGEIVIMYHTIYKYYIVGLFDHYLEYEGRCALSCVYYNNTFEIIKPDEVDGGWAVDDLTHASYAEQKHFKEVMGKAGYVIHNNEPYLLQSGDMITFYNPSFNYTHFGIVDKVENGLCSLKVLTTAYDKVVKNSSTKWEVKAVNIITESEAKKFKDMIFEHFTKQE